MKKLLLGLGSVAAIAVPIVTLVSCAEQGMTNLKKGATNIVYKKIKFNYDKTKPQGSEYTYKYYMVEYQVGSGERIGTGVSFPIEKSIYDLHHKK